MKTFVVAVSSLIIGTSLGASFVQQLHAQAKAPIYQISLQDVSDEAFNKDFAPAARASIKQYGGTLVAAGSPVAIEGTSPYNRYAINRWDSLDQMKKWYDSPEYVKARTIGDKYAKIIIVGVPGIAQ